MSNVGLAAVTRPGTDAAMTHTALFPVVSAPSSPSSCAGSRSKSRPSATTTTNGASTSARSSTRSGTVNARNLAGPDASARCGWALCGSHFTHSHSGPTPTTAMARSSG